MTRLTGQVCDPDLQSVDTGSRLASPSVTEWPENPLELASFFDTGTIPISRYFSGAPAVSRGQRPAQGRLVPSLEPCRDTPPAFSEAGDDLDCDEQDNQANERA
jgi:hypothetical protein